MKIKKIIKIFNFIPIFLGCFFNNNLLASVLVTLAPYKFFVEKIGGKDLQVNVLVPAGASSHTYEPTFHEITAIGASDIWFQIGESFEARTAQALKSHYPHLKIIDLRKNLSLIYPSTRCCGKGADVHFWLSPKLSKIQAQTIAEGLIEHYPDNKDIYLKNLAAFEKELDELDAFVACILSPLKDRFIFVSHPAYAYFCRDYHLTQVSIEIEGQDPRFRQSQLLLEMLKEHRPSVIFIQKQYSDKAARILAEQIGARLVLLDPYQENYFQCISEIAHAFAKQ